MSSSVLGDFIKNSVVQNPFGALCQIVTRMSDWNEFNHFRPMGPFLGETTAT